MFGTKFLARFLRKLDSHMGGQEIGNGGIPRLGDGTTAACNQQFAALTRDRGTNAHHLQRTRFARAAARMKRKTK